MPWCQHLVLQSPQVTLPGPAMILALPGAHSWHCHICHFRAILLGDSRQVGPCKGGQATVQQAKNLGRRGNSTEEKEQAECSVLACVGMCQESCVGVKEAPVCFCGR